MLCLVNSPESPPDVEAHGVEPEECRQKPKVHYDSCNKNKHFTDQSRSTAQESGSLVPCAGYFSAAALNMVTRRCPQQQTRPLII